MQNSTSAENYFSLLELPEKFEINEAQLRAQYFAMQRKFHPDNAKTNEQRLALIQQSANVNAAYNNLKNAQMRLYHLLKLRGFDLLAENNAPAPAPEVLFEVMELREEAEAAISPDERTKFQQKMQQMQQLLMEKCAAALELQNFKLACDYAIRLRYADKILQDLPKL